MKKSQNEQTLLMRSLMFVPAHNLKLMTSAISKNADILLLDLEDSVQPSENKQIARDNIIQFVQQKKFGNTPIFPRVNDRESGHLLQDVYQLTIDGIAGFMYPKSQRGEDVYFFDKLLETIEYEKGIPIGTYKIIPLIETTAAVVNVNEICQASSRIVAVAYGCEDFISDLGGIHDKEGKSLFTARAMIAMAAKANGVIPIDTVHINVHDMQDLEENLKLAKVFGFEGMMVLNPKELSLAHEYFSPSQEELKSAHEILLLAEDANKQGKGVAFINGKFIGPPMIISANKTLLKQELIENKKY